MPTCRVPTSGPAQDPGRSVKTGVAAHITAASPGGARYDDTLTPSERRSAPNGIWLCQTHAKLVDNDASAYPVAMLLGWKIETETLTSQMLAAGVAQVGPGLELRLPSSNGPDSLLSFTDTDAPLIGRAAELIELETFLSAEDSLSWWAWTGSAGAGKSRLALELCRRAVQAGWNAGFIGASQQSRLGGLQNLRPTLVVVDYAAEHGPWLADALAQLSERNRDIPVRVLVLERTATGAWWDDVETRFRAGEGAAVMSTMYAMARNLDGLGRGAARAVVRSTAARMGREALAKNKIEAIVDRSYHIDPAGRPLFVQVATFDVLADAHGRSEESDRRGLESNTATDGRDAVLRRVLGRQLFQLRRRAGDSEAAELAVHVLVLATALGGTTASRYLQVAEASPAHLLPGAYQTLGVVQLDELLLGMKPDILGEMLVLDKVTQEGLQGMAAARLARLAFDADPDAFAAFVERAAADHHQHPGLLSLLRAAYQGRDSEQLLEAAAAVFAYLQNRDDPVVTWTIAELEALVSTGPTDSLRQLLATARFRAANLALASEPPSTALVLFKGALVGTNPDWPVRSSILNNRGIAHLALDDSESAFADFTAVIESPTATDEARACALNNRADVKSEIGDTKGSIRDRTELLALPNTTYNRRYIALIRRAVTQRACHEAQLAYTDIEQIVDSDDIAIEQKMNARLKCATWLHEDGFPDEAVRHLDAILASYRNFDGVEHAAAELRDQLTTH